MRVLPFTWRILKAFAWECNLLVSFWTAMIFYLTWELTMYAQAGCVFLLFESPVNLVSVWKLLEHELFCFYWRVLLFTRNFSTLFFDLGYVWKWIRCKSEGYLRVILWHDEHFTWGILESDTLIWGLRHLSDTWDFIVLWMVLERYLSYLRSCVGSLKAPDDFGDALYFTIHGYDSALVFSRPMGAECFQQHHSWT